MTGEEFADAYQVVRCLLTDRGPGDRMVASEATERIFRRRSEERRIRISKELPGEAEYHGVAPLLKSAIDSLAEKAVISDDVRRSFIALASRHCCVAVVRERCIDEWLEVFAALKSERFCSKVPHSHTAYIPAPHCVLWSTSMCINPTDIERVVRATSKLGYSFDLG